MNDLKLFEEATQKVNSRNALSIEEVTSFCKHNQEGLQTLKDAGYPIKDCTFKDGEWRIALAGDFSSVIAVEMELDDLLSTLTSCKCVDFEVENSGVALSHRIKNPVIDQWGGMVSINARDKSDDDYSEYVDIDTDYICSIRRLSEDCVLLDCGECLYTFTMHS